MSATGPHALALVLVAAAAAGACAPPAREVPVLEADALVAQLVPAERGELVLACFWATW